ncbi:uncharacterized protein LOC110910728 [Helianthus annuus]|uniref:uncharacterized protein LOC110910728 n=1 Tax=Helianthus annuus TaxID=4232 RepID=UPI000B8F0CD1|nr:uncharacterized protein LOC110910728 [Helianthus annuus]
MHRLGQNRENLYEKEHIIQTGHGSVSVIVYGDQEKPPLITYPHLALNHMLCFQGLFFCPEAASLLLHNFCIYHISPPGDENFFVASGLLGDRGSLTLTFPGPSATLELWRSSSEFCAIRSNLIRNSWVWVWYNRFRVNFNRTRLAKRVVFGSNPTDSWVTFNPFIF